MAWMMELVEKYLAGTQMLRQGIAGMTRQQLLARPNPNQWTTLEVVCHLADSDQAWIHRMKRIIAEERPLLIGYDETRFAKSLAYHDRDVEEELNLFDAGRRQMAQILRKVPSEALARQAVHNESGLLTLEQSIGIEIDHVTHHLKFVTEKRRMLGCPAV